MIRFIYNNAIFLILICVTSCSADDNDSGSPLFDGTWKLQSVEINYNSVLSSIDQDPQSLELNSANEQYELVLDMKNESWKTTGLYEYSGKYTFGTSILFNEEFSENREGSISYENENKYSISASLFYFNLESLNSDFNEDMFFDLNVNLSDTELRLIQTPSLEDSPPVRVESIWTKK